MDMRARRLANLFERGRRLHWQNMQTLCANQFHLRLAAVRPPRLDLIYRTIQLVAAVRFIQAQGYVSSATLDAFLDDLFDAVAQKDAARIERLVAIYAASFGDERAFSALVAQDVIYAVLGKELPNYQTALARTGSAVIKTTCLYCAEAFDDEKTLRALR